MQCIGLQTHVGISVRILCNLLFFALLATAALTPTNLLASSTITVNCGGPCGPTSIFLNGLDQPEGRFATELTAPLLTSNSTPFSIEAGVGRGFRIIGSRFVLTEADLDEMVDFSILFETTDDLTGLADLTSQVEAPFLPSVSTFSFAPQNSAGPARSDNGTGIVTVDALAGTVEWTASVPAATLIDREVFGLRFESGQIGPSVDGLQSASLRISTANGSGVFRVLGVPEPSSIAIIFLGSTLLLLKRERA